MDRMIYLSMAGAKAAMQRQDVLSHNLANVSTVGLRAELAAFRAVPVQGDGASTRVYALETTVGYDGSSGVVQSTGRPLDVAMKGNAWLSVQALDGTVSAKSPGGKPLPLGKLKLVTPEGPLSRGTDALFRAADGELPADANARLQEGALEGSNVSAVETMVSMISAARQFEHQMKLLQLAERQEQQATKLLSPSGI